jgi:Ca2+/Na+ antiporter
MAGNFKIKLVHFLGWFLLILSFCIVIAGLFANKGESLEFGIIGFFAVFMVFGFFLTRYKKEKKAELSENKEKPKKTLSEKLQEQKEKSIQKEKKLQDRLDELKKQPETKIIMDTKPQKITEKIANIKDRSIRIKTLEQMIIEYQEAYYNGEAEISDGEFDLLWDELKALNPNSPVLKKVETLPKERGFNEPLKQGNSEKSIFHIEYVDAEGKESSRDIEIMGFLEDNDKLYIIAFCHLANDRRQFLIDRIVSISLWDQPIENPQQFLRDKYEKSAGYITQKALNAHADEILALIFLARADGKLLKNEREVIGRFIDILISDIDAEAVEKMLKNTTCELAEYNRILKRAKSWDLEIKKLVMDAASQIIALKKQLDPMEKATFDKLKAAIS